MWLVCQICWVYVSLMRVYLGKVQSLYHAPRHLHPHAMIRNAEHYLVKVLKRGSDATHFSDLWAEIFHFSKDSSLHNLPPTSQGLLPHIQRGFYNAYITMHTLESYLDPETIESLKPEDCGYEHDHGHLIPATSWKTLEVHWSVFCSCDKCARSTCPCRMAGVKCCKFCRCKKTSPHTCKNPIAWYDWLQFCIILLIKVDKCEVSCMYSNIGTRGM